MAVRDLRNFDPDVLARLDADMWVAYYHHRFFRLFVLLLQLNYTHFRPSLLLTVRGAYHSAAAAVVFRRTKGNEDTRWVLKHLAQFYELLSVRSVRRFDYQKAAELELAWWLVDRYKTTRAVALAEGMAAVYNVPAVRLRTYGEKRAAAMELLGDYHHDTTVAVDWGRLRQLLGASYAGLHAAVQGNRR